MLAEADSGIQRGLGAGELFIVCRVDRTEQRLRMRRQPADTLRSANAATSAMSVTDLAGISLQVAIRLK